MTLIIFFGSFGLAFIVLLLVPVVTRPKGKMIRRDDDEE